MSDPEVHDLERQVTAMHAELTAFKGEILSRLSAIDGERGRVSSLLVALQNKTETGHKLLSTQISLLMQMMERVEAELAVDEDGDA